MTPSAHLLISWLSTVEVLQERRERAVVTVAGVMPDIDGLGLLVDKLTGTTELYWQFHHYYGHGIFFAVAVSVLAAWIANCQKVTVLLLTFLVVHLHILCDVIGSRGPDGYQWPIYYLAPLNNNFELVWSGQWTLNAWQNMLIFMVAVGACVYYAATKKISFFEVVHPELNRVAIRMFERLMERVLGR